MKLFSEMPVYIEKKKAGNSNPKCYLSDMKGCSDKISKEHYISKNLLDKIEKQNSTIDIGGLSWLPKECEPHPFFKQLVPSKSELPII